MSVPPTGAFPLTRLSVVVATGNEDPVLRREAWDALIRSYWKPVYKYIRMKWQIEPAAAEDLTQEFFTGAIDAGFFQRFDPARARFRTYLRVCLHGFVANARKAESRQKRGGGYRILSLDFADAERELSVGHASAAMDEEQYFRTESIRSLLGLAVSALRDDCAVRGRHTHFALFERYDLAGDTGARPTYQDMADALGLTITQVTNQLATARREFRRLVLEQLRAISGTEAEFRHEAVELLGVDPDDVAV